MRKSGILILPVEEFKGKEEIEMNNPIQLNNYLFSGTVKGMITFMLAQEVLQKGGYIVVDEVENYFNKEIVTTLMRFFMDSKLNKNGGTLFFSTHYPELLDEYDRNDSIYIIRNRNGITAGNLSTILKRNDIKKSDASENITKNNGIAFVEFCDFSIIDGFKFVRL